MSDDDKNTLFAPVLAKAMPCIKSALDKKDTDTAWRLLGKAAEGYLRVRCRSLGGASKFQGGRQDKPRFRERCTAASALGDHKPDSPATAQLKRLHKCMRQIKELRFKQARLLAGQSSTDARKQVVHPQCLLLECHFEADLGGLLQSLARQADQLASGVALAPA